MDNKYPPRIFSEFFLDTNGEIYCKKIWKTTSLGWPFFSRFFVFELHNWKISLQRDKMQGERGEHPTYTINLMHP